jgi:hypothetical protein
MPDFVSIGISVVIIIVIFIVIYFILLKPSSDSADTAVTTIQSNINALSNILSEQNINVKDITENIIPKMQSTLRKSIEDLSSTVDTKNTAVAKLIDDLKTATANLSTSSTQYGTDISSIKTNLGTLQTNLDNLVKSQAIDIKSLKDKDIAFDTLLKSQADEIKRLKEKDIQFDEMMKSFKASEATDTATMKASIDQILGTKFPNLTKTIDDLIAQKSLDIEALKQRFPQLENSFSNVQNRTNANVEGLQRQLEENSKSDKRYQDYVNVINKYIDNAMAIPEISDRVKQTIFTNLKQPTSFPKPPNGDYLLEFLNLTDDQERTNYLNEHFKKFTGCEVRSEWGGSLYGYSDIMVFKQLVAKNDDDAYEYLLLFFIPAELYIRRNEDGMFIKRTDKSYSPVDNIFSFLPPFNQGQMDSIILILEKLGMPPLTKNPDDTYSYSYSNTKTAVKQAFKNYLFDCENWQTQMGRVFCKDMPRLMDYMKNSTCDSRRL